MTQLELLKQLADLIEETVRRHGLALRVAGGECLEPGHVVFDLPCPANAVIEELAARAGADVIMRMQVDVTLRSGWTERGLLTS